jgi:hypothetical protein
LGREHAHPDYSSRQLSIEQRPVQVKERIPWLAVEALLGAAESLDAKIVVVVAFSPSMDRRGLRLLNQQVSQCPR